MNSHTLKSVFTILLALFCCCQAYNQVPGCTDPMANNFNSLATVNDGSCTYNNTSYTPPVKVDPVNSILAETSGLEWAGNSLWTFNDSGGEPAIYRIDTLSNTILQKVSLQGASNTDWEDIAFDGFYFYIGDFGNNSNGARTDLKIYKFPFSAIPEPVANPDVTIAAADISIINFIYSDQPQPPVPSAANSTKFDCEAMIVDDGKIHLFSKNWVDLNATHYVIGSVMAGTYIAMPLETLATNFLVTAADKSVGNKVVALLGYQVTGLANHFMFLLSGYTGGYYFNGNKRKLDLPNVTVMGQAEGICFKNGHYGYISNERVMRTIGGIPLTFTQKLRSFDIRNFVSNVPVTYIFTGNGNWNVPSNWSDLVMPPPAITASTLIFVDPLPGGSCILNIPYTIPAGSSIMIHEGKYFVIPGDLLLQ
ncbi:MAG: hypothetical protein ABI741_01370 [Ferruginibacter sp.]